jgi:long-chain fatty acid transport protein
MPALGPRIARIVGSGLLVTVTAPPARAAGFSIFEQGSKAMGEAMAFTAQADDPSAMYYNVGGLGLLEEREFYAGLTLVSLGDSRFVGAAPFPGPTQTGDQTDRLVIPPHFYWVQPLGEKMTFGLSLTSPFGLVTQWDRPDTWSGRFISEKAELFDLDLTPNVGFEVRDNLAVGVGVVVRFSSIELRNRAAAFDPFLGQAVEVAKVDLESDLDVGVGLNFGVLHRATDFFSWGLSYRSKVEVDYSGNVQLTQQPTGDPVFDAIVAGTLPFGRELPVETSIEFPDQASLGLGLRFSPKWMFEVDFNWTGWSSFDTLVIDSTTDDSLDSVRPQNWDDAVNVRGGVVWDRSERAHWRFGVYFDETPQPEESVSPVLPDADRVGLTLGFGLQAADLTFDIAALYVDLDDRTVRFPNSNDGFYGTYMSDTLLLGVSFGW